MISTCNPSAGLLPAEKHAGVVMLWVKGSGGVIEVTYD